MTAPDDDYCNTSDDDSRDRGSHLICDGLSARHLRSLSLSPRVSPDLNTERTLGRDTGETPRVIGQIHI